MKISFKKPRRANLRSSVDDDLTQAEKNSLFSNVDAWTAEDDGQLQRINVTVCKNGIDWTRSSGFFPSGNQLIPFEEAMSVGQSSLQTAFQRKYLIGILAVESRFGHVFTPYSPSSPNKAIGGFQIQPNNALKEFNQSNDPEFAPIDIDDRGTAFEVPKPFKEFNNAAQVAAWYFARNLQYCTLRRLNGVDVGSISDAGEAPFFAAALYNQGIGTVAAARKACMDDGNDNTIWDNVKTYMDSQVRKYVARVALYGENLDLTIRAVKEISGRLAITEHVN